MSKACKCCGHEVVGSKCPYCGCMNIALLDNSASSTESERCNKYKMKIIEQLRDFSIEAYNYKWNETTSKLELVGRIHTKIADGNDSFGKIKWSEKSFGQNFDDNEKERTVTIGYEFKDQKHTINAVLKTVKCDDFWKIGIRLNDDLTISIYLGTESNYTSSGPYPIEIC